VPRVQEKTQPEPIYYGGTAEHAVELTLDSLDQAHIQKQEVPARGRVHRVDRPLAAKAGEQQQANESGPHQPEGGSVARQGGRAQGHQTAECEAAIVQSRLQEDLRE